MIYAIMIYTAASYFTEVVIHYLSCRILGRRVPWPKLLLAALILDLLVSPMVYLGAAGQIFTFIPITILSYFLDMTALLFNLISIYLVIERNIAKTAIAGTFAYFIYYQTYLITFFFIPKQYALGSLENQCISITLLIIFTYFIGKIITKIDACSFIERCLKKKRYCVMAALIGFLLSGSPHILLIFSILHLDYNNTLAVVGLGLLFLSAGFFRYVTKNIIHDENEKAQQSIIAQQTAYIQNLEEIQKDVRLYRHDFKNMMSGMYLDIKEGKTEALERYMHNMLDEFDQSIGAKIQSANQMMNIEIIELKSLLMTKISQMHALNIPCHVEVLYPVRSCHMKLQDLLRCVGILTDNAIEAVKETRGDIDIILTAQNHQVVFLISNPISGEIDMNRISQKGYSTKGKGRGLGLYSYQEITQQYQNVSCAAFCKSGRFYQEIRIGGYHS